MPDPKKDKNTFSSNQVAALIEDLKSQFRSVIEAVEPLPERLEKVEERLACIESEVRSLKDVVSIALPDLNKRVTRLEAKVGF